MNEVSPAASAPALDEASGAVSLGNLKLDLESYRVSVDGRSVEITYREFELLRILARQPGRVLPYELLTSSLWGVFDRRRLRHLNVVVHSLRAKLAGSRPYAIETVRGRGYGLLKARGAADDATSGERSNPA